MTIEINGMAHVILTVSQFDAARAFYGRLLPEFGMKVVHDGEKLFYCVGARTAIGIEPCDRICQGTVRAAASRVASSMPASKITRGRGSGCGGVEGDERDDRSRAVGGDGGTRILLRAVRRPGRDQARSELCSWRGSARRRGAVQPFLGLSLRLADLLDVQRSCW
jgi:catechol 2,3-dioxygenase-like lactoylglutathione lyase family enzyme